MKALDKLDLHLKKRLTELTGAKEQGRKIVGYAAGGYLPEELILACGAIPIGYAQAGDNKILNESVNYLCRWFDPFWRSQIGYAMSGKDPYYNIADIIVTAMTDQHSRQFCGTVDLFLETKPSFFFGVPHHTKDDASLEYYLYGINRLKDKLEEFTGVKITDTKLKKAIELCNRERELFRKISEMRESNDLTVNSRDFIKLHHGSFLADKEVMIDILESYFQEAKQNDPVSNNGPRIYLTGGTLAMGDSIVMDLIEASGGVVVMENFDECLRPYWNSVSIDGDLMANLAQSYYMDRICPGWFRPVDERLDFLIQQARDYNAHAVIWYQLLLREPYKLQSIFFPDMLKKETGLNMLIVESEYDSSKIGQITTRIETFMESIKEAGHG